MKLVRFSCFLTFLFVISITIPAISSYMDLGFELSEHMDKGENEESKVQEPLNDQEFKIVSQTLFLVTFNSEKLNKNTYFSLIHYQNNFVEKVSPPPEELT